MSSHKNPTRVREGDEGLQCLTKSKLKKIELVTRLGLGRLSSTETQQGAEKISQEPTVFDKRKADHKKKFTQVSLQNLQPINGDSFFLILLFQPALGDA